MALLPQMCSIQSQHVNVCLRGDTHRPLPVSPDMAMCTALQSRRSSWINTGERWALGRHERRSLKLLLLLQTCCTPWRQAAGNMLTQSSPGVS